MNINEHVNNRTVEKKNPGINEVSKQLLGNFNNLDQWMSLLLQVHCSMFTNGLQGASLGMLS